MVLKYCLRGVTILPAPPPEIVYNSDIVSDMVKTFQLGKAGKYGESLKIAPVSTDSQLNKHTCLQVNGSEELRIQPQSILPDLSDFKVCSTYLT